MEHIKFVMSYVILFILCIIDDKIAQYSLQQNALYFFQVVCITVSC
jgi:hypothetical protein